MPRGGRATNRNSELWFCRGEGKCTATNRETRKVKCDDCVPGRPEETVGELANRLERGDG